MKRKIDVNKVENNEEVLNSKEREDRISILNLMVNEKGPLPLDKCREFETLDQLIEKGKLVLNEDKTEINFAYPISGLPTSHKVTLADGREFHSMCAIDSLGSYFTFWQDLEINSTCSVSGEPIKVVVKDGKISDVNNPNIHCIHVDLNEFEDWSASC
ncbi:MAG: MerB-like organometallic lyase SaoL [Lagierella massiliensis]|nr:MerB-like organometallic lyase SaoL [Lagierella massiliensis]